MSKRAWAGAASVCAAIMLSVSGCTSLRHNTAAETPPAAAQQTRLARLAALTTWAIDGRIAIKDGAQGWHASVLWQEQAPRYQLELIGPFGQGRARVEGGPDAVTLISDKGRVSAADPDQLLAQALGVRLPIGGLRYWIRGMISPQSSANRSSFDDQGRLVRLEQDGWIIDYPNYIDVGGLALPKRMRARSPERDLSVKVVIQDWRLDSQI